ncbi:vicilin-like seed storage protein At2g18540 isoform X1 [Cucurbita pepo subsp. pepo]|uniref:vicilin-like seed storage protein At2g18540 isoform X1 n=1 Tax=Cucurbita pepo subsp. pepo TaxID=3664 RepID=UPI000C9D5F98|nr:vicilin-like seed storage protein At2g18540 isoform X1 [Cucurbita pepo subsp. pepo]
MAFVSRSAIRNATNFSDYLLRSFSTSTKSAHHNNHQQTHKYLEANAFVGSWEAPKDPKEAQARLALLRRDYAKKVKQVRKNYIQEGELLRLEKQRKDEAKQEALRVVNEERKKLKAEAAKARAEERKVANEEFRQTLMKERAEKLEHWRMMKKTREEKKNEKNELIRRQSSMWIDDKKLEEKLLDAIVNTTPL